MTMICGEERDTLGESPKGFQVERGDRGQLCYPGVRRASDA